MGKPLFDLVSSHNFKVVINLSALGFERSSGAIGFNRIEGIRGSAEVIKVPQITDLARVHSFPGRISYDPVRMSRGVDQNGILVKWWNKVATHDENGPPLGFKASITIFPMTSGANLFGVDRALAIVLHNAWPSSLEWGTFDAQAGGFLINAATFEYEYFGSTEITEEA